MQKLKATSESVIVRELKQAHIGSLVMPTRMGKESGVARIGRVVSSNEKGVNPGDIVAFSPYGWTMINWGREQYVKLEGVNVLAVLDGVPEGMEE